MSRLASLDSLSNMKIIIIVLIFLLTSIRADQYAKDFIIRYINALQSGSKNASSFLSKDFELTRCDGKTKWNREQVLGGPVFEKFGIFNEIDWDIEKSEEGKLKVALDGFIEIEYFTKTLDSKLVIISERQFNCHEVQTGLHIAKKLFNKYKEAIRTKNQTMANETIASKFSYNRRCRNDEKIGFSEFYNFLETLPTETIPLHEANVLSGNIANDMMGVTVLLKANLLINYLLVWSEEKRTFLFMKEFPNKCRNDNDYTSPLIDEKMLGKMIAEELVRKYGEAYKFKSKQRFDALLSEGFITESECSLVTNLSSTRDYRDFISHRLYEPVEPTIRNIEVDFFKKTVKAEVQLNDDSTVRMIFEGYKIESITLLQCNITLSQSQFANKDKILQKAKNMEEAENIISRFVDAIRNIDTALLYRDIVSTPFTIINTFTKTYNETDFDVAELYPNPMPDMEVVKATRTPSGNLYIEVVAGPDISYEYKVSNVNGKVLITTENR